jgi:UDP-N-acetyl-D-mannosaminuronic acid dehydrogenase
VDQTVNKNIVIVGGCGHVGLPLGLVLADHGMKVTLLDIDSTKVNEINAGEMPFLEDGAEPLLRRLIGKSLRASLDDHCLNEADIVVTVVGTPVDRHLNPNVHELYRSMDEVIYRMKDDALLVLRSTVYPGVTKLIHDRIAALGRKILLACCPERIAEGKALEELVTLPQLISAFEPRAMERARDLFLEFTPSVIELQPVEAELAKLFTNSWRYLNFAISNQFYILAQGHGVDFYKIYDAATRDYPRMKTFAKPGFAAGPCLLKDTLQLAAFAQNNFFLGHAAMLINEGLPNFIVQQLERADLAKKCVVILGMAFKAESDDIRESLSCKLRNLLQVKAREVLCSDPYVKEPGLLPAQEAVDRADIVILGAPHAVYRDLKISPDKIVVDVWNFWASRGAEKSMQAPFATVAQGPG